MLKHGEMYADDPDTLPDTLKAEEEIVMAMKRMQEASSDAVVRELMEHRQKALHDEATLLYHARKEGIELGTMNSAEKMLKAGMAKVDVARILEIPVETL